MKKQDLKRKISEAYRAETPDLRERVLASCMNEKQEPKTTAQPVEYHNIIRPKFRSVFKPIAAVAICLMLFVFGFSMGIILPSNDETVGLSTAETVIYLDVNPSIELQMDSENKIVGVVAGNEDAEIVLTDLKLNGLDINTALKAIVGSMYVNGYLSENSNSLLISVNSKNDETADSILCDLTEQINTVLENSNMECAIIAQCLTIDEELLSEANKHGISVGKMCLLNKIVNSFQNLSSDAVNKLSSLSINDLNLIYLQRSSNGEEENTHELISGKPKVNITSEQALENVLKQAGKDRNDIANSCVFLRPSKGEESKVVYAVNMELPNDSNVYKYEVDCQSGDVFMVITFATLTSNGVVYRDILLNTAVTQAP